MKIVILDGERTNPGDLSWACIGELGELTVYGHTSPEETVERIADNEVVIVDHTQITREIIEACPSIRLITLFATGYNVIDV
jgi:glycerate dehydrogenase